MSVFLRFCGMVDTEVLTNEFLNLLKTLIIDESQTIQVMAIEVLTGYAALLKKASGGGAILTNDFLPYIKQFSDDPSWRLRQGLAREYGKFSTSFAQAEVTTEVFPALIHMVLDPEPEVRTLAIQELLPYMEVVGTTQFVAELSPVAVQLADDPVVQVRKLLAELCVDVAVKVGPEAVALHLSDLIIRLMNDEDPLVRLRIIKRLHLIAEEAPSLCTRLTEALKVMFSNNNWRVRKALVEAMPAIVKHMGQDYYVDHFLNISLILVKDCVQEVRDAACLSMARVANVINDMNWAYDRIFPTFKSLAQEDYLTRLTMVTALQGFFLLDNIDVHERFQVEAFTQLMTATKDKVPNVRLRAAQALHAILSKSGNKLQPQHKDQILGALSDLQSDKDRDVVYFATQVTRLH
jgi:serine/threonine-protein phosphatase 2A regulatory subunit A